MTELNNNDIKNAFLTNDKDVLEKLYNEYVIVVKKIIYDINYDNSLVYDIMNESMLYIYEKIRKNEFDINCKFSTYFYSVCRNMLFVELRKNKLRPINTIDVSEIIIKDDLLYNQKEILFIKQKALYLKHFNRLSEVCQKLISLSVEKLSLKELAEKLNIKSDKYVKKLKYKCKGKLLENIKNDVNYKELLTVDE